MRGAQSSQKCSQHASTCSCKRSCTSLRFVRKKNGLGCPTADNASGPAHQIPDSYTPTCSLQQPHEGVVRKGRGAAPGVSKRFRQGPHRTSNRRRPLRRPARGATLGKEQPQRRSQRLSERGHDQWCLSAGPRGSLGRARRRRAAAAAAAAAAPRAGYVASPEVVQGRRIGAGRRLQTPRLPGRAACNDIQLATGPPAPRRYVHVSATTAAKIP